MGIIKKIWHRIITPRVNYQPLIEVRIFKDNLLHNLAEFQKTYPKLQFAPVLKSNAYGHGLVQVAKILDQANQTLTPTLSQRERGENSLPFFMVDSFYEALTLRQHGVKTKILVLGYATIEQINKSRLRDVSYGIIDFQQLKNIASSLTHKTNFHLKIDTGMHRQGILPEDLEKVIIIIRSNPNIIIEGACSHFADADGTNPSFTKQQIAKWNEVVAKLKKEFPRIEFLHLSNTAGVFYGQDIDANVSRVGIGLFGFNTSPFSSLNLKPALEMVSIITSIKTIPAGEKIGYNVTYTAPRETKVATVPAGYNEGVDIRLSNKGFLKIKNQFCPIVGRVSMNMCSIDVTDVKDVKLEDEVIIISKNPEDKNSIDNIVKICGGNRYEVPVRIPRHLRKVVA